MDASTTRRLAAVGLAVTFPASVYAVTGGGWLKATISLIGLGSSLLWGFWPDIRWRFGFDEEQERLVFEPVVLPAEELFRDLDPVEREALHAFGEEKTCAAVVRVTNISREPIELSAKIKSSFGPTWELAWSRELGTTFVRGGSNVASLPGGGSRLLLVAIGYTDLGWHRYDMRLHFNPSWFFTLDNLLSHEGMQRALALSLETRTTSRYVRLVFSAPDTAVARGFRLLYSKPTLAFIAAGSSEDLRRSTVSEQDPQP